MTTRAMGATAAAAPAVSPYAGGVWSWITTVDHKRIAILYGVSAFVFFLLGGIEALIIRTQLAVPNNDLVTAQTYNELFTMHGTTMIFLAIMPLNAMYFNYLVPLMIGARDVAFPRLNAFSYWVFLAGALVLNWSWIAGAAPDTGWFGYANLTSPQYSPGKSVDYWLVGLQILGVSSLASAFNFIVTIVNLRAPGMRLMRMPPFVWMTLITNVLVALAFPVVTVALILLTFDRYFGTHFYIPQGGGDPVLWQHLFWVFGHPEVYILILPAFGIISEVLPTFARKPLFGYPFVILSGIGIAVLGFGVWAHHMFAVGMGPLADAIFAVTTMAIAIPTGVKIFNWLATLWGGSIAMRTPLLYGVAFIAMFTMGGLSGVHHASPPADLQQTDTYYIVAHFHYVLFGGALFALLGGFHYWFPKMTGKMLDEKLGKVVFWLALIGFNLTFFPMHMIGLLGMPRRIYTYHEELGLGGLNMASTIGAFVLMLAFLVFIWTLMKSLRSGDRAPVNPWDAPTLEWSIPSPPPAYNFAVVPTVQSRYPLWEERSQTGVTAGDGHGIHLPNPSFWPAFAAVGLLAMGAGGVSHSVPVFLTGVGIMLAGFFAWAFEPAS
ncbi:MAG TPA: cytochrome c oxidase subunit I [Thermodesulfobacteriota bacterium]